jgi:hypothetical protein
MASQWRLNADGSIETADEDVGDYWIDKGRLAETTDRGGVTYYDWPVHIAEKMWVNLNDFEQVFRQALSFNRVSIDTRMLDASFAEARRVKERYAHGS